MSGLAYYASYRWEHRNSYPGQKLDYWYACQPTISNNPFCSFYVEFLELPRGYCLGV